MRPTSKFGMYRDLFNLCKIINNMMYAMDFFMYYDMGLNLTKESWFFTNTKKTNTYNVNTVHDTVSLCIYFTLKKKRGVSPCYVEQQQQQQLLVLDTHTQKVLLTSHRQLFRNTFER